MAGLTGRQLGEFLLEERLARGGAGEVYAAHQPSLGRAAVVKVMRAVTPAQRARVEREARLATRLDHPYAAHVYAFGDEPDGVLWIAMERVSGETLADRLAARGKLALAELLPLFEALCEVVDTAHAAGLVHRDIKPANVMIIERAGRTLPKLLDFGIAVDAAEVVRAPDAPSTPAAPGAEIITLTDDNGPLAGTPGYMAPEQWQPGTHGRGVDIYALGVVAYRCLAGRLPFAATTAADLLEAHAHAPVPAVPGLPSKIFTVLERALAKRPADRFATAGDLSRALVRAARPRRTRWIFAALVGLAALVGTWLLWPRAAARWEPQLALLPAYDENADRPLFSPDGTHIAFSTDRERSGRFRLHVAASDGADDRAITPPDLSVTALDWSTAGLIVADLASDASYRVDPAGGPLVKLADHRVVGCGDALVGRVRSAPGCATCERLVRSRPGVPDEVLATFTPGIRVVTFRCDQAGRRLVYSAAERRSAGYQPSDVWVLDLASRRTTRLTDDAAENETPVFTRDGAAVLFASARGGRTNLWEVGIEGGVPVQRTTGEGNDYGPDLAPDGRVIYSVDTTTLPLFANAIGGAERRVLASHVRLQQLVASPTDDTVYATDFAAHPPAIVAIAPATGELRVIAEGEVAAPRPDGRSLVIAHGAALAIVDLPRAAPRPLATLPGRVERLRVGRDGVVHAMIDRAGSLEAWRVAPTGEIERDAPAPWTFVVPGPTANVWLRFDPAARTTDGVVVAAGEAAPSERAPRLHVPTATGGDLDARGTAFVFYDGAAIQRLDLASGQTTRLFDPGEIGDSGLTLSADGATVYTARTTGRTRRVVIENFAARD